MTDSSSIPPLKVPGWCMGTEVGRCGVPANASPGVLPTVAQTRYFWGISHTDLEPSSSSLDISYSFWAGQMGKGSPHT